MWKNSTHRVEVVTFYRLIISSIVKPSGFLFMMPVWLSGLLCGDDVDDFCDKSKIGSADDVMQCSLSVDVFEWICMCVFRLARWLKLRLQTGHLCGDSSKCVTLWTAKVRDWQKPLPQSLHLKGFSLEWMYRWSLRWSCRRKALPQISQLLKNKKNKI